MERAHTTLTGSFFYSWWMEANRVKTTDQLIKLHFINPLGPVFLLHMIHPPYTGTGAAPVQNLYIPPAPPVEMTGEAKGFNYSV